MSRPRADRAGGQQPGLSFIDGEWPLFGAPDEYAGVRLEGTGSIRKLVATPTLLDPPSIERLAGILSTALPAKSRRP